MLECNLEILEFGGDVKKISACGGLVFFPSEGNRINSSVLWPFV